MEHKNRSIGFADYLVPFIKEGAKQSTYRLGTSYDFLQVGDIIPVRDSKTKEVFGEVEITGISKSTLKDIPIDIEGHEKYASKEEQKRSLEEFYPGISEDSVFTIINFRLKDK
jgi:hypothetical protein